MTFIQKLFFIRSFNLKKIIFLLFVFLIFPATTFATVQSSEDLDPFAPDIEQQLQELDALFSENPNSTFDFNEIFNLKTLSQKSCVRKDCPIWIQIVKSQQKLFLFRDGNHTDTWLVSTGVSGRGTPNMDLNPNGRIYDRYSSTKFPGGDFEGLGNMPYAVFLKGGFAIHGTPKSNWKKLGQTASHGCIRIHPDNAYIFNRLVRNYGVKNVWVTIQD